ncbi:hypothetical protein ZIOFF_023079 [Zingiber officinale]|uniref:Uncharacterized protein n=1 Tax=Zingiber officinale TaxID=94328 RepID=A0A8J5HAN0_ZINOF|nr:hypothetical protein ZIOFF_023079 [Zingiber officinale]
MCYPENFLAVKANEVVCGQLNIYSAASSPKEKYLAGDAAGRSDRCNNERRTLSKQTSLRETKMEAKWEKRRRQILERERRVVVEAEEKEAAEGSESRGITRPKILTDEDMDELRGSIELGFGFVEEEGGNDLRDTLPALNLYFAVNRQLSDKKLIPPTSSESTPRATSPSGTPKPNARTQTEAAAVASYAWPICSPVREDKTEALGPGSGLLNEAEQLRMDREEDREEEIKMCSLLAIIN